MPLPAKGFDLIVSRFGVMFFEDPIAAFRNLHAALRDNGRIVFICWRTAQENPWMAVPSAAAFEVLGPPPPPDAEAPGPFAFGDPDRIRHILDQSGFSNIALEAVDQDVHLGTIDEAVRLMSEMGPAAHLLREASEPERARAIDSVSRALTEHQGSDGVRLPSGTWIVSAGA
jgi:SAM-dependent methyltransferase